MFDEAADGKVYLDGSNNQVYFLNTDMTNQSIADCGPISPDGTTVLNVYYYRYYFDVSFVDVDGTVADTIRIKADERFHDKAIALLPGLAAEFITFKYTYSHTGYVSSSTNNFPENVAYTTVIEGIEHVSGEHITFQLLPLESGEYRRVIKLWTENLGTNDFSDPNNYSIECTEIIQTNWQSFTNTRRAAKYGFEWYGHVVGEVNTVPQTNPTGGIRYDVDHHLNMFYTRIRSDIYFLDTKGGPALTDLTSIPYEMPLSNFADHVSAYVVDSTTYTDENGAEWTFKGWYDNPGYGGDPIVFNETTTMPAYSMNLYAKWEAPSFTVTFDADGGTYSGPESVVVGYKEQVTKPADPSKDGMVFVGWKNSDGTWFNFGTEIYADHDLTAVYQALDVAYTVAYEPEPYGTFNKTDSNEYLNGASAVVLGAPTVTNNTKLFTGWKIKPVSRAGGSGGLLLPGDSFAIDKTQANENRVITLVAQYADKPGLTTLTYEPNGGKGSAYTDTNVGENNQTTPAKAPDAVGISPQPGWEFLYWTTNADGSGDKFHPTELVALNLNGDRVLYAQWKQNTTSVKAFKIWSDNNDKNGKRANAGATVQLYKTVGTTKTTVGNPVSVPATDGEIHEWTNLPQYEGQVQIQYSIKESLPEGSVYTVDQEEKNVAFGGSVTFTNSHTPEKIDIPVEKIWDDHNDSHGLRPGSVTIHLYADGEDTGKSLTLTAAGHWKGAFTGLDKYSAGRAIAYYITEDRVPHYRLPVIGGSALNGFTVTNSYRYSDYSPQTGDHTPLLPWFGVLLLSGLALAGDAVVWKHRRRKEE